MVAVLIILIVIETIFLGYTFLNKTTSNTKVVSKPCIYDMKQNYMEVVNTFLKNEFDYEMHIHLTKASHEAKGTDSATAAVAFITRTENLQKASVGIVVNISQRMSSEIKKAFYRVYNNFNNDDSILLDYITRYVNFRIRSLVSEISIEIQKRKDLPIEEANKYLTSPVQDVLLRYELELYKDLSIVTNDTVIKELTTPSIL